MSFKKIIIVIIMVGGLLLINQSFAATTAPKSGHLSYIVITDDKHNEVISFNSNQRDELLGIYARLYVDSEWKAWRYLNFDVWDPQGNKIIHKRALTSFLDGYVGIGISHDVLSKWEPGKYILKVTYDGNDDWPAAERVAAIYHTK